MYNAHLPAPIACGMLGGLAGLIGGGFNQCFPIWVGGVTGLSVGCAMSVVLCFRPEQQELPVAQPVNPVIVQNIYIMYDHTLAGASKTTLPVATVAKN